MNHSYVRVCCATPKIRVADTIYNSEEICKMIDEATAADAEHRAQIIVFPETCITGYTCNDLFWQESLLSGAKKALVTIARHTTGIDALVAVGLPFSFGNRLYNVAAFINNGQIIAMVPKTHIPNYGEFYEVRHFASGRNVDTILYAADFGLTDGDEVISQEGVVFSTKVLLTNERHPELCIACEICEDLWVPNPPSVEHAIAGANVIVNLSASNEVTGKAGYRKELVAGQSGRLLCAYLYASAGEGESTQDLVFSGHNMIAENGSMLSESKNLLGYGAIYADIDLERLMHDRRRMNTFEEEALELQKDYVIVPFSLCESENSTLLRPIAKHPFVPADKQNRDRRCEDIISLQAMGLKKRLEHTHCRCAVIGLSGGLDSTLALLVTVRAFDLCGLDRKGILSVTMPCFGTTDRTYHNACDLANELGTTLMEVNICDSVRSHFKDINQSEDVHDVTYENGQARERTQVLMDLANQKGGMVIGTGDMSELALGWATYNGDHMSMYGVNCSVPKTLVRYLVAYFADKYKENGEEKVFDVLTDILDTPVSPELLPPKEGEISQKTEDLVGPYELHDFFLYYVLRFGFGPERIYGLARAAFAKEYDNETILKWLKTFFKRFFAQQFKRSCLPDGPKVGTVSVSPRGDLRMPSDASASLWMAELETLC